MVSTTVLMITDRINTLRKTSILSTALRRITTIAAALIFTLYFTTLRAEKINKFHQSNIFSMETLEDSTLTEGLAGSFFGKQGNHFILAGGSSFPAGKPWEGGKKHFSDQLFLFRQNV